MRRSGFYRRPSFGQPSRIGASSRQSSMHGRRTSTSPRRRSPSPMSRRRPSLTDRDCRGDDRHERRPSPPRGGYRGLIPRQRGSIHDHPGGDYPPRSRSPKNSSEAYHSPPRRSFEVPHNDGPRLLPRSLMENLPGDRTGPRPGDKAPHNE